MKYLLMNLLVCGAICAAGDMPVTDVSAMSLIRPDQISVCAICLDEDGVNPEDQYVCGNTGCPATYHKDCIMGWFKTVRENSSNQDKPLICEVCRHEAGSLEIINYEPNPVITSAVERYLRDLRFGTALVNRELFQEVVQELERDPQHREILITELINFVKSSFDESSQARHLALIQDVFKVLPSLIATRSTFHENTLIGRIGQVGEYNLERHHKVVSAVLPGTVMLCMIEVVRLLGNSAHRSVPEYFNAMELNTNYRIGLVCLSVYFAFLEYVFPPSKRHTMAVFHKVLLWLPIIALGIPFLIDEQGSLIQANMQPWMRILAYDNIM